MVVKKGNPDNDELEQLANDIDPSDWKKVARKLKIHDPKITAIHKENEEFHEKIYQMLLKWKQANGSAAVKKLIETDHLLGAFSTKDCVLDISLLKVVTPSSYFLNVFVITDGIGPSLAAQLFYDRCLWPF